MAGREQAYELLQHLRHTIHIPERAQAESLYIPRPALVGQDIPGFNLSRYIRPNLLPDVEHSWVEEVILEKFAAFIELYFEYKEATEPPIAWTVQEWGITEADARGFFNNPTSRRYSDTQAVQAQAQVLWAISQKWQLNLDVGPQHILLTLPSGLQLGIKSCEFIHPEAQFPNSKAPDVNYEELLTKERKGRAIRQKELARLYIGARVIDGDRGRGLRRAVEALAWTTIHHRDLFDDPQRQWRNELWSNIHKLINDDTDNMVSGMRNLVVPDLISGRDFSKLFSKFKDQAYFWGAEKKKEFADLVILAIGGEITFQNNNKKGIANVNRIHREGRSR